MAVTHFLLLLVFAVAVGGVLGAMLRAERREALVLAAWIAGGMVAAAVLVAWALHLLPR